MKRFIRIRLLRFQILSLFLILPLTLSAQEMNEVEWSRAELPLISTISFWPQYQMPENGQLLISGTPDRINGVLIRQPQLVSGDDSVRLLVHGYHEISPTFHQALLTPERELIPEREYRLQGRDKRLRDSAGNLMNRDEEYRIYIRNGVDTTSPRWVEPPTYVGGCYRAKEHYLYLAIAVEELDPIVVETTIIDSLDNVKTYYLFPQREIIEQFDSALFESRTLPLKLDPAPGSVGMRFSIPDHLMLAVGHGKYGGGIEFGLGGEYKVRMRVMDASGNRSETSQEGIITVPPLPPQPSNIQQKLPVAGEEELSAVQVKVKAPRLVVATDAARSTTHDSASLADNVLSDTTQHQNETNHQPPPPVGADPEMKVLPMIPRFDGIQQNEENKSIE